MNMAADTFFESDTLDDLLAGVFNKLLVSNETIEASRGKFAEIFGAFLVLHNPRARLSRSESKGKIFSAIGELLWYLSKSNRLDFMEYYLPNVYTDESDDGMTVRSGYGERLFDHNGNNQIHNVITLLREKPTSRRAVIQLFDASDLSSDFNSIPCTCTLQFIVRNDKLNLLVNMRSNDAYLGLPHDVFAFTMLQEIVARSIGIDIGIYKHCAGSLHLYDKHRSDARTYLVEGWQSPIAMEPMPLGDPWNALALVGEVEEKARTNQEVSIDNNQLAAYWMDLCRLLVFFQKWKYLESSDDLRAKSCREIRNQMSSKIYHMFLDARLDTLNQRVQ